MKPIALVMLVIVILVVVVGFVLKACAKDNEPPTASEAPYKIQTDSNYYYAAKYTEGVDSFGKFIVLKEYWSSPDGKNWEHSKKELTLSRRGYLKPPTVTRRQVNEGIISP